MDRAPGWSVRLKLTLSYAAFIMVAGALLLGAKLWRPAYPLVIPITLTIMGSCVTQGAMAGPPYRSTGQACHLSPCQPDKRDRTSRLTAGEVAR